VKDFDKLKRFNVEQLYEQYQSEQTPSKPKSDEGKTPNVEGEPKLEDTTEIRDDSAGGIQEVNLEAKDIGNTNEEEYNQEQVKDSQ
jgi:hypothetical protein